MNMVSISTANLTKTYTLLQMQQRGTTHQPTTDTHPVQPSMKAEDLGEI